MAKNDIDRDISLPKNNIERDISLAKNDIDRDISLAKNYIDREGIFEEAKRGFVILDTISSLFLTLSVNNILNQHVQLKSGYLCRREKRFCDSKRYLRLNLFDF